MHSHNQARWSPWLDFHVDLKALEDSEVVSYEKHEERCVSHTNAVHRGETNKA